MEGGDYSYGGWRLQLWKVESMPQLWTMGSTVVGMGVGGGGVYSFGGWSLHLWRVEPTVMQGGVYVCNCGGWSLCLSYRGWSLHLWSEESKRAAMEGGVYVCSYRACNSRKTKH